MQSKTCFASQICRLMKGKPISTFEIQLGTKISFISSCLADYLF